MTQSEYLAAQAALERAADDAYQSCLARVGVRMGNARPHGGESYAWLEGALRAYACERECKRIESWLEAERESLARVYYRSQGFRIEDDAE